MSLAINDYDSALLDWLYKNQGVFQFKFSTAPVEPWYPSLRVLTLAVMYQGLELKGHSCGKTPTQPRLIALTECLERAAACNLKMSSNGFAAHPIKELALEASWQELVERDAFLWHWHHHSAPVRLEYRPPIEHLPTDETMEFYQIPCVDKAIQVVLAVNTTPGEGIIIGLAGKRSIEEAAHKAALEAAIVRSYNYAAMALDEVAFGQLTKHTPYDHVKLGLDPSYARHFQQWLSGTHVPRPQLTVSKNVELLDWPEDLAAPPLFLARARHAQLLPLYFGFPAQQFPNPRPHPLG